MINMPEIILKNITKKFGKKSAAVENLSLEIPDRSFITLLGPSGCGKTTTLRMIAGLETPTSGEITIGGKVVYSSEKGIDISPDQRGVGFLFQNYALWPHMTVWENITFGLENLNWPKVKIKSRAEELMQMLKINEYKDRYPSELSGGQQQRGAIARTLSTGPKILFMDEPLSNLDAKLRNQMRAEIIKLRKRINTTFMYVTHDQTEAMTLGDRIVIMKDGFVNQIGAPQDLFNKPVNLFVAGFIGMPVMNFFDGCKLELKNGEYYAVIKGVSYKLDEFQQKALKQNGQKPCDIICGVRPCHVTIGEGELKAKIEVSEMLGSEVNLHADCQGDEVVMVIPTVDLDVDVSMGSSVNFTTKPRLIQLFDKATTNNLIWFDEESFKANAPVCKTYNF